MTLKRNQINRIATGLDESVADAMDIGAEMIKVTAQSRVPVATGTLKDSIRTRKVPTGGKYSARSIEAGAFYAHMVEFGTVKMGARPFLIPAFEAHRETIERRMRDAVQRRINGGV